MFAAGKTTSGVAAQTYVDDVFSTYLYTGNGSTQTINNGIGLSTTAAWSVGSLQQGGSLGYGITIDSSGNIYAAGYATSSNTYASISKYNSSGVLQWQRSLQQNGSSCNAITTDSSGNVYATGYCNDGTNNYAFIVKYNSSGTIQWQRKLSVTTGIGYGIDLDSSNNIYIVGSFGAVNRGYVAKYDNSGTIQWQRQFYQSNQGYSFAINIDSSDNIYVTGSASDGTAIWFFTAKYNTAGTIQWQRKLLETDGNGRGVATDASGNVYVTGNSNDGTNAYALIAKYNSSGTIQWQRKFFQSNSFGYGISTDSSGNVYVTGYSVSDSNYAFVAKYNTSGTIQWQRKLKQAATVGTGIATYGSNVYSIGYATSSGNYIFITQLAQDGSTTSGVANGLTMTVGTATESAGTATESAGTATEAAGAATDAVGVATDSAGTATYTYGTQAAVTSNGGMVWLKDRTQANPAWIMDTLRGTSSTLQPSTTGAAGAITTAITNFNSSGFSIGTNTNSNTSSNNYVSWTFREAPKFFDVVTYTGNGVSGRQIAHSLGQVPGMIIVKSTSNTTNWAVNHTSLAAGNYMKLNATDAASYNTTSFFGTNTSTTFQVGSDFDVNANGYTYVAYLFAHDTATDGIIQCGSWTGTGTAQQITLGWEPQFILAKNASSPDNWFMIDTMRSWPATVSSAVQLYANSTSAEVASNKGAPNATGFSTAGYGEAVGNVMIYLAIRRPNKPPTTGTQVYNATATASSSNPQVNTTGFAADLGINAYRDNGGVSSWWWGDRLRGKQLYLRSSTTAAEASAGADVFNGESNTSWSSALGASVSYVGWGFRRAPGVFDEVCYTGTGANTTQAHNLGVVPEMMIVKNRSGAADNWYVYHSALGSGNFINLDLTAVPTSSNQAWNNTVPTSTVFSIGTLAGTNGNTKTFVAYLFATVAGISKVFSYTGNGTSQTINCGFTTGARFVLIKRTDSTGDWYVWDSARGIVAGNDPHLSLNTTAAEVTTDDSVDTNSTGFIVNQVAATNVNVTSATYIGLAFA